MFKRIAPDLVLLKRIGSGGMGEVFLAKLLGYGGFTKLVAVKCYHTTGSGMKETRDYFIREAQVSARLKHANVVQVFDFGETKDSLYMTMEYVDGKQCSEVLDRLKEKNQKLPMNLALYVIDLAAQGLAHAHGLKDELTGKRLNLIHRDISPHNMMMSYNGQVKLLDFGLAKMDSSRELTPKGAIVGKQGYLAPEQLNQGITTQSSDIFSLGVCLYEFLVGEYLFDGDTSLDILRKISNCEIPQGWNQNLPEEIQTIFNKILEKDIEKRYYSAEEFSTQFSKLRLQYFPEPCEANLASLVQECFAEEMQKELNERAELWDKEEEERPADLDISGQSNNVSDSSHTQAAVKQDEQSMISGNYEVVRLDVKDKKPTKLSFDFGKNPFKKN